MAGNGRGNHGWAYPHSASQRPPSTPNTESDELEGAAAACPGVEVGSWAAMWQGTRLLSLPPPVSPSGPFSKTRASCLRREIGYGGGDVAAGGGCGGEFVEDAVWACTAG